MLYSFPQSKLTKSFLKSEAKDKVLRPRLVENLDCYAQ